jgi:hypothetical protein
MKPTRRPSHSPGPSLKHAVAGAPLRPQRAHPQDGADDTELLAALTFELMLVAGRPCLATAGPYDVGRIRLF